MVREYSMDQLYDGSFRFVKGKGRFFKSWQRWALYAEEVEDGPNAWYYYERMENTNKWVLVRVDVWYGLFGWPGFYRRPIAKVNVFHVRLGG